MFCSIYSLFLSILCLVQSNFFPPDSARSFMKKHRIGHFNEEETAKKKAEHAAQMEKQKAAADAISVGNRCKVQVPGQPMKLGTVMYVGKCGISLAVYFLKDIGLNPDNWGFSLQQCRLCCNLYGPLHNQAIQEELKPLLYIALHVLGDHCWCVSCAGVFCFVRVLETVVNAHINKEA